MMIAIRHRGLCLVGLLLAFAGAGAGLAVSPGDRIGGFDLRPGSSGPIEIQAASLAYDGALEWATAAGNVRVRSGDQTLRADRARLNSATGDIEAWGNIVLDRGVHGVWRGEHLRYNFKTGEGLTTEMVFEVDPFTVRTAQTASSRSDGRIDLDGIQMTTCTNAPGHEHYQFRARRAILVPGEYVSMRGASLRLFGVPLLYSPWLYRGLRADQGWRFDPGYSSRMGAFLLSTYRRPVYRFEAGGRVRSRTRLDYRTRRGVAGGQSFDWETADLGEGEIAFYLLRDQRPYDNDRPRDQLDATRYRALLRHSLNTSPVDRWQFQADSHSDGYLLRDFYEDEYRRRRQPDNFLSYTHRAQDYSAGGLLRFRLNDFYDQVERLPELWFDLMRREALVDGLYYESQNRLAWLHRRHDELSDLDDYDAWRADSNHLLAYPFKTQGFLQLVPRAGARATYYSETLQPQTAIDIVTVTETNAFGEVTSTTTESVRHFTEPAGADLRVRLELGLQASFRAYRTFLMGEREWRHVVEPYADYTLIPEPNLTPDQLYQFDGVDQLNEVHGLKFGVRNLLQTRSGRSTINVVDVNVHTTYHIARDAGADPLDRVFLDARLFPDNWLKLDARGVYSLNASGVAELDTRLQAWRSPAWQLSAEHNYRAEQRNALSGSLTYSPSPRRRYNLYGRYDYQNGEIEEQGGYVEFALDCLAIRIGGYVQPGYERDDGSQREIDYRILFNVWLTAFPPENLDRRYRQ